MLRSVTAQRAPCAESGVVMLTMMVQRVAHGPSSTCCTTLAARRTMTSSPAAWRNAGGQTPFVSVRVRRTATSTTNHDGIRGRSPSRVGCVSIDGRRSGGAVRDWQQWRGWRVRESTTSMVAITGRPCAQQQQQQQRRAMSFWTEFAKAFKERAESSKELTESMAELKKLQEAENLKKTKESMEKIKDKSFEGLSQIKNIVSGSKSGEVTTEKMSGTVVTKLEELRSKLNQSNASEKAQNSNDASDQASLNAHDRVSGIFSSIGGVLVRSATSTTKTTDDNPALEAPTTQEKEVDEVVATEERKPEAPVVLKSTRLQTAAEGRMQAVTNRLRSTSAYKNALALREKLVESDNPLIQRALDVSDSVFRFTSKLFSENDYAKTIKLIHSLDPTFSTEQFKQQMVSSFVPTLRKALLRGESGPISALMSKRLAEHELEVLREIESRGYRLQSRLLNLDNVEILNAHTRDDGRPTLIIHFVSQENHCVRDHTGAVVEGAVDNIQDVEQTWALQINSQGKWEVIECAIISSRPSW